HIWHWRDWIVESLNQDKGYDRMLQEMLAGDELAPDDPSVIPATGYLARQYYLFNRTTWLDDTLEHTSKAFLGLTMNCVKCHAHKYDPIAHEDYYRLRAFFEPYQVRIDSVPGQTDTEQDGIPRAFDAHPELPTYLHVRGDDRNRDTSHVLEPGLPAILQSQPLAISPISLPPIAWRPSVRQHVIDDHLHAASDAIAGAEQKLKAAQQQLARVHTEKPQAPPAADDAAVFLEDDFSMSRPDLWETGDGEWSWQDGELIQRRTGAQRAFLRTRQQPPGDFEATLTFRTIGGERWKSVGLAWDVVGDNEKMVYLSAVSPGSKLQVSYKQNGNQVYPPNAAQQRPVELDRPYTMTIAVRNQLVNVALDGQHAIAFEIPLQREAGLIDLIAFDAAVRFDSLKITSLPLSRKMIPEGDSSAPITPELAAAAVKAAEADLHAAQLRPEAIRTAVAAERALADAARKTGEDGAQAAADNEDTTSPAVEAAIRTAAQAFRNYELAVAQARLANAELKPDDDKALAAARQAVEQAAKAVQHPDQKYFWLAASSKAAEGPDEKEDSLRASYPHISTGRRLALAQWMTNRQNPLVARVAVNHIWMRHFGQPLVDPVDDFGLRTKRPVQHQLLDWLAADLMEHDWSMKRVHRLIVTSQTWQRDSSAKDADPATVAADPTNQFYWRHLPVRMEAQVIRDSLLHLAGDLDLALGGPTIPAADESSRRRSLYFFHSHNEYNKLLSMFDDANVLECYRRSESVVPQQALTLENSKLALDAAEKITRRIEEKPGSLSDPAFVQAAFAFIL
ncbi:MAG: DUF1553 domain-containing protein, partial [Planctomycetaceae bacterium]|nr:DUF1553 domain-containing protein [Planctomycetaceae bacterium]